MWWLPLVLGALFVSFCTSGLTLVIETGSGKKRQEAAKHAIGFGVGALVLAAALSALFVASYPQITIF